MKDNKLAHLVLASLLGSITLGFISSRAATTTGHSDSSPRSDVDVRLPALSQDRGGFSLRSPKAPQLSRFSALEAQIPGLRLRWDGMSGSPSWIVAGAGELLAMPFAGDPESAAKAFLRDQAPLFGLSEGGVADLQPTAVVPSGKGGSHVHFRQTVAGIEVFGAHVVVNLRSDGAVRSAGSRLFGDLVAPGSAVLAAADAIRLVLDDVYPGAAFAAEPLGEEEGVQRRVEFDGPGLGFPPRARLVLFPEAVGGRLAWEVRVAERTRYSSYRVLIDAVDGRLLFRENTTFYAESRHLSGPVPVPMSEEYEPTNYIMEAIPSSTPESPGGWIDGDGTSLAGNNATSHMSYWWEAGLVDPLSSYDYPFNTPESALANLWWWVNELHDRFYAIGFDEPAGNLQENNFGKGGMGGDPLKVVHYDTGPRVGGFVTGSVDGGDSTLNVGWSDCHLCADHDGLTDVDAVAGDRSNAFRYLTVAHEYTHAVTSRLAGGPATTGCANGTQAGALSEATSDFFATSFVNEHPRLGNYNYGTGRGRSVHNDLDYGDFCDVADGGCGIHDDGMIWSGALWDLRESMIALAASGLESAHRLVLEGWAGAPCDPSYLDLRDAILDADAALFGAAHHEALWNVFASRGMGENATTTGNSDTAPVADFGVPAAHACTPPATPADLTASSPADNVVELDYAAQDAAGIEIWREDLTNPLDLPGRIALTDDTSTFVDDTVQGGHSYRYHVVALGAGGIVCRSPASATADVTVEGFCDSFPMFDAAVTVVDGDPSCEVTLSWDPAAPGCAGQPIVYNVYRGSTPGFEPSERFLIGRTTATLFGDVPPQLVEFPVDIGVDLGNTSYYLVLAQHGTLDDPPDHRIPVPTQLLKWVPAVPTLGRETASFWDFDGGADGWTADNTFDPDGGWVLLDPDSTWFAGALLAPDEAAGGSGSAWVTGDGGNVTDHDCDVGFAYLTSPVWDGTGGATLLSLDYWAYVARPWGAGIDLYIDNGSGTAAVSLMALNTTQPFGSAGRHGWQRAELDLAEFIDPTATMSVTLSSYCASGSGALNEFGIDNVRVERATVCQRSGLRLEQVTVDDSPAGWGNGNGLLEPGETARLLVQVSNQGATTASSPTGTLSSGFPGLLVHEPTDLFPNALPEQTVASSGSGFTLTVPQSVDCDETVLLDFDFVDLEGTVSRAVWNPGLGLRVTDTLFEDDFETDKGWTAEGSPGAGQWQRGDPVGTMDGANPSNPEGDSPFDAGLQCYVTENTFPGADANTGDVDSWGATVRLASPLFDLTGYKQARFHFDLWFYDNSTSDPAQDYARDQTSVVNAGTGSSHLKSLDRRNPTGGWLPITREITRRVPMTHDVQVSFFGYDTGPDHVVEVGVDNFRLEGDRWECDPLDATDPPNGVGNTVLVDKSGAEAVLSWDGSPADVSHDEPAYYRLYASPAASAGFAVVDTVTVTAATRPLDGLTEYYLITAVNAAGTSGDEPSP